MRILNVSYISSKGSSFRITFPTKIIKKLRFNPEGLIVYGEKDGELVLRKMKVEEWGLF